MYLSKVVKKVISRCDKLRSPSTASLVAVLTLSIVICAASPARSEATAKTSLDELIRIGLEENPGLMAKRLDRLRSLSRLPVATALDDPVLAYTQPISEIETRLGPVERTLMVSQKIPFPGKRRLKGDIVKREIEMAGVALEAAGRDLVLNIKKAYFELYYLERAVELSRERINIFDHFTRAEMNDYSVGSAGLSDVVSAESRFADAEYDLILFEELRSSVVTRLNTLLNRDPESLIAPLEEPEIEEDESRMAELYALAKGHESVLGADLKIERNRMAERLSGFSSKPDFMLGAKYSEIGEPPVSTISEGGRDELALTFAVTIPLWFGKNRAVREGARLARLESEQERTAISNALYGKLKKSYADMKSNYKLLKLYSDSLIPKAGKLTGTVEIMYKNGNGSIADLFEARSMLVDFKLALHRATSNYLKNRAELERFTSSFVLPPVEGADDKDSLSEVFKDG